MNTIGSRKSRQHRILTLFVFFLLAFGIAALGNAATIEIVGVETTVLVTSTPFLDSSQIKLDPLGDAELDRIEIEEPPGMRKEVYVLNVPITGGIFDTTTNDAMIEHDNSGFSMTKEVDGEDRTLFFRDLLIDTEDALVSSDTTFEDFNISDFPLFDLTDFNPAGNQFTLNYTATTALVLQLIFELNTNLTGAEFGKATVDLQVVPIPAAFPLLLSGLAGLAVLRRKFRR